MLAPQQPEQPDHMPDGYQDKRTDWQIYDEICHLEHLQHNVLCDAIRDYQSFNDRIADDIGEIERRKAMRARQNAAIWPAAQTTLVSPKRSYNLHATIHPGRMRIVEAKEEEWGRSNG